MFLEMVLWVRFVLIDDSQVKLSPAKRAFWQMRRDSFWFAGWWNIFRSGHLWKHGIWMQKIGCISPLISTQHIPLDSQEPNRKFLGRPENLDRNLEPPKMQHPLLGWWIMVNNELTQGRVFGQIAEAFASSSFQTRESKRSVKGIEYD